MNLVSIIIPVFNGEKTIERAINSCLNQTYQNIEVLVVDNCSTDESKKKVANCMKRDSRIKLLDCPIKGRSRARNVGLDQAKGDYIQLLDADDVLAVDKIKTAIQFFEENPEVLAYSTAVQYVKGDDTWTITPSISFKNELLVHNIFPINSIIYKSVSTRFKSDLEYDEDWLFWVDLFYTQLPLPKIDPTIGGSVYVTGVNTMSNTALMLYYEVIVRGMIKQSYPKNSVKICVSDLKKSITVHVLYSQDKISKQELIDASRFFGSINLVARCLIKLPGIGRRLIDQVNNLIQKENFK
ncbi:glycosyltransferase family 2 protein [Lapidilactobacillus gannanensis]|uniref:Glycosyltransferase family 2 protein n=1 Tax=Lapidilactobacillus gannanensis TaxID=2486002 RepID=A0ABW4BMJ9_9LACO|nr:glycosyltransferase family A protein [Lapidilactobacillus gannanensis]